MSIYICQTLLYIWAEKVRLDSGRIHDRNDRLASARSAAGGIWRDFRFQSVVSFAVSAGSIALATASGKRAFISRRKPSSVWRPPPSWRSRRIQRAPARSLCRARSV